MLRLPARDATSTLRLADWIELNALLSPDENASAADLEGALRVASYRGLTEADQIEGKVRAVFQELESRERAAGHAYPFVFANPLLLEVKQHRAMYVAYLFCLCLSYRGAENDKTATQLFEKLACRVAGKYLWGQVLRFGSPRGDDLPTSFSKAVDKLCASIGEGRGYREQPTRSSKDCGLDVVAWKQFPDNAGSQLLLFGQCAAGHDWGTKLTELQPEEFWANWIQLPAISPKPMKSLFIPHRVERTIWEHTARKAGIVFDRCRIAYLAYTTFGDDREYERWVESYLTNEVHTEADVKRNVPRS